MSASRVLRDLARAMVGCPRAPSFYNSSLESWLTFNPLRYTEPLTHLALGHAE